MIYHPFVLFIILVLAGGAALFLALAVHLIKLVRER